MSLMATIAAEVAARHDLSMADLRGPNRADRLTRARAEAMTQIYETGQRSLKQIGVFMGGRDHSTVYSVIQRYCAERRIPCVYRGLSSDPARDLWIVSLRQNGLSYTAIARALKISRSAVAGVVRRARYTTLSTGNKTPVDSAVLLNDPGKEGHRIAA